MWTEIRQVLPILGMSLCAWSMGVVYLVVAMSSPSAVEAIPVALAFMGVALLGTAVLPVAGRLSGRIRELERRLEDVLSDRADVPDS
jgi:hypothetical protein